MGHQTAAPDNPGRLCRYNREATEINSAGWLMATVPAERMFKHLSSAGAPKFNYWTEAKAVMAAVTMQARYQCFYDVYRCPQCGYWHVGRRRDKVS